MPHSRLRGDTIYDLLRTDSTIRALLVRPTSLPFRCRLQVFNLEVQARWDQTMTLLTREHGCCRSEQMMRRVATSIQPGRQESAKHSGSGNLEHFLASSSLGRCFGTCNLMNFAGILLAYSDTSLVWATHETIASRFDSLQNSSWMMTSFTIGYFVTLPMVSCFPMIP